MELHLPERCVVLVVGPPGAGKTTWAARVAPDTLRLDIDTLREQLRHRGRFGLCPGPLAGFGEAIEAMIQQGGEQLDQGKAVILETVGVKLSLLAALAELGHERELPVYLLAMDVEEELWREGQRLRRRILADDVNYSYMVDWQDKRDCVMMRQIAQPTASLVLDRPGMDLIERINFVS